jgi:hypothetical protein
VILLHDDAWLQMANFQSCCKSLIGKWTIHHTFQIWYQQTFVCSLLWRSICEDFFICI